MVGTGPANHQREFSSVWWRKDAPPLPEQKSTTVKLESSESAKSSSAFDMTAAAKSAGDDGWMNGSWYAHSLARTFWQHLRTTGGQLRISAKNDWNQEERFAHPLIGDFEKAQRRPSNVWIKTLGKLSQEGVGLDHVVYILLLRKVLSFCMSQ